MKKLVETWSDQLKNPIRSATWPRFQAVFLLPQQNLDMNVNVAPIQVGQLAYLLVPKQMYLFLHKNLVKLSNIFVSL